MKIAVITGASSGLGTEYAYAVSLLRQDIDEIWLIARRLEKLEEVASNLSKKSRVLPLDITNADAVKEFETLLINENAEVSLLINNAGFGKLGMFYDISADDNAGMIRLNCEALTVFTSVTLPFMSENAEIINTCSIASFAPNSRMAVYSSTKAFVMSFSRALREELKSRKINVLAVCPGPMETEFLSVAGIDKGTSRTFDMLPRDKAQKVAINSLKASRRKKAVFCDHFFYKFYRVVSKILPTSLVMKMAKT
jgi:short-subunit dehydrogenase